MPNWDFDTERAKASAAPDDALSAIQIEAKPGNAPWPTALYHSMMGPNSLWIVTAVIVDRTIRYIKRKASVFIQLFSLWDTYRALHPLLSLVQPQQRNADFVNSLVASQKFSPDGILPVWQFHGLGNLVHDWLSRSTQIADLYMKGVGGFDAGSSADAMVKSAEYGPTVACSIT